MRLMEDASINGNTRILTNECEYFEPGTISEAIALLAKHKGEAKVIAGGTDVLVDMKKARIQPKCLISLMKIPGLSYIAENKTELRIGAGTTVAEIEGSRLVKQKYPVLSEAASSMGTPQTRNMATVAGNICNALPSADIPPALVALDAEVKIAGKSGKRSLPLEDFLVDIRRTKLRADELLVEVVARRPPADSGAAFLKVGKTSEDLATVNVAARLTMAKNGTCKEARIVVGGGVGVTLIRSKSAEALLQGKTLNEALFVEAAEVASQGLKCRPTSIRGSPYYKTEICKVLVKRALMKALERAKKG